MLDISTHFTHLDPIAYHLFCSCRVLEDVRISGTIEQDSRVTFRILLPMLRRLSIHLEAEVEDEILTPRAILDIPNVEQLSLCHQFLVSYTVVGSPNLVTADIDIRLCSSMYLDDDDLDDTTAVYDLVRGLSAVHSLQLSTSTRSALVIAFNRRKTQPAFPNLTQLEMGFSYCCGWSFVGTSFHDSPISERITSKKEKSHTGQADNGFAWELPPFHPVILQELQLVDFNRLVEVMALVEYFVENATLLKKLTVRAHGWSDPDKVTLLNWASERECEVKFV